MIDNQIEKLPIHSTIAHYPVLFWTMSVISDIWFYFSRNVNAIFISKFLLGAGIFTAIVATLPAFFNRRPKATPAGKWHTGLSLAATITFAADFFLRGDTGMRLLGLHLKIPFILSLVGWVMMALAVYVARKMTSAAAPPQKSTGQVEANAEHSGFVRAPSFRTSYRAHLRMASVILLASIWLSSGSMAPYGATLNTPLVQEPCQYLVNIDHSHHQAVLLMLEGKDKSEWGFSVVLRRWLFTVLAFPFMRLWGFETGGFMASVVFHLISFHLFVAFLKNEIGTTAAVAGMWLLATYPGISYWAALPYAYAAIVPCSLCAIMLLWKLERATLLTTGIGLSLLLGVLFIAYDLLPFFGLAAIIIVVVKRRYRHLPWVLLALIIPSVASNLLLRVFFGVGFRNDNTDVYYSVIQSYLHKPDVHGWIALLTDLPRILVDNYLFSNFLFLPLLFLILCAFNFLAGRRLRFSLTEKAVLLAVATVFLFNNVAPPYPGWQLRGYYITRLYQPLFIVLLLFSARMAQQAFVLRGRWRNAILALLVIAVVANATVAFGPVIHNRFTGQIYYRFYRHASPDSLEVNLNRYGRRPLGFCRH